jgi:hypothetical protein
MCSGKGFNSTLLSFKYPKSTIHMIDNNKKIKIDHVQSLPNVTFHLKNIREDKLAEWVQGLIGGSDKIGPKLFFVNFSVLSFLTIVCI